MQHYQNILWQRRNVSSSVLFEVTSASAASALGKFFTFSSGFPGCFMVFVRGPRATFLFGWNCFAVWRGWGFFVNAVGDADLSGRGPSGRPR